jgi:6-pyruvoyltetrahydropterin/6-carboxytetrahydropterin synthase
MIIAERYHDISAGHRVTGHENKCRHLHGHNYRVHFKVVAPELDSLGRVMDFSVIKTRLCMWLEDHWDHKFLLWEEDPYKEVLSNIEHSLVVVPFNPTAENMAKFLVEVIGPAQLLGTNCKLIECRIEETRKCSATYSL